MKIIVAGVGKIGDTLIAQLCGEGHDLTVVDTDRPVVDHAVARHDVMAVLGNCASMDTLRRAGIQDADLLIAATGSDEGNLLCAVSAHAMNPAVQTVVRIRNPEYTELTDHLSRALGISMTFHPEKQAADEIARLLRFPGFLKRDTFAHGRAELVELKVEPGSPLCGIALRELHATVRARVLVCVVVRDGVAEIPSGAFVLRAGDRLFVTATREGLSLMLKNLGILPHKARRVLIIGGGRISYYLAQELAESGIHVKIIERERAVCEELAAALPHAEIINGDVSHRDILEEEGLACCDALITLTGNDELNMIVSLYGKRAGVAQILTKLAKVDDSRIIDSLPLGSIICPRKLCCNGIVRFVRALAKQDGAALTVHVFADGYAEAAEFLITQDTPHSGEPLRTLRLRQNILISSITRDGRTQIPDGNSSFLPGDSVVVVSGAGAPVLSFDSIFVN